MWRWLVLGCVTACGPGDRSQQLTVDATTDSASARPEGAWEPDPGFGRSGAYLVADGPDVWFAYARSETSAATSVWLTRTTSQGDVVIPPTRVDSEESATWPAALARTSTDVAIVLMHSEGGLPPRLRLFDRSGAARRSAAHLVPMSTLTGTWIAGLALAARPNDTMRLFATHDTPDAESELVAVDLDASGDAIGDALLLGNSDTSSPMGLSAATTDDGATRVAWDRRYDHCQGYFDPDATLDTSISNDGTVASITDVNPAGLDDREPALAALGEDAYIAWTSGTTEGAVIRLARADDVARFIELGIAPHGNHTPAVALADAGRGAIAWMTDEPAIRVAQFTDGGLISADGPHVLSLSHAGLSALRGLVHVGGARYVVAWEEEIWLASQSRLFALELDLSKPARPAPSMPIVRASHAVSGRRCSH